MKEPYFSTKRIAFASVILLLGINLAVAARIYSNTSVDLVDDPYPPIELVTKVMELIRKDYVEGDISYKDLSYGALQGMLSSLDPHSQFMEPKVYQDMREDTEGHFGGLGIVISMSKEGFLTVIAPMEDTPGARAGLLPGDRIIKIEDLQTDKMSLQEAVRLLRGVPGTEVTITVFRQRTKDPGERIKEHTIERAIIKVESVKDAKILEENIGYVRITQFNQPTALEFERSLIELEKQGMDSLILDLRNNPGGLLESARQVASKFVPSGKLIVSTEGRDSARKQVYRSDGGKKFLNIPMVILVNHGSASGSEIVAGALQDLKTAVVVGETTFGKGSVQSILQLPDGSAVRLTTAKYYTPSHKVIHEKGVTPDIEVTISVEDERALLVQRTRAKLPPEEGEEKVEPIADVQLDRAIAVLKGVKLFAKHNNRSTQNLNTTAASQ